mmetsp:Transcript_157588/g.302501  ORF Transcript_157588/g.302501 Transcript_157588/m.302501 type:complete len:199 (-) Transcript_157588:93-689(-)
MGNNNVYGNVNCNRCHCNEPVNDHMDNARVVEVQVHDLAADSTNFDSIRNKVQNAANESASVPEESNAGIHNGARQAYARVMEMDVRNPPITREFSPKRPPFDVVLSRVGPQWRNLGVIVDADEHPDRLVIDDVLTPSLIAEWNSTHNVAVQVIPGDSIIGVNGSSLGGQELLKKIMSSGFGSKVTLQIKPYKKIFKV